MEIDTDELTVHDNEDEGQYEIEYDGRLALLAYFRTGDRVVLVHTEVPEALEGHGIAGRLAQHALEDARAKGLRVVPRCPYVQSYLEKHPEYADLVDASI
ncbi:MAG: GNAT family N-acetyltransferase [Dehalococcoidia bacterium]